VDVLISVKTDTLLRIGLHLLIGNLRFDTLILRDLLIVSEPDIDMPTIFTGCDLADALKTKPAFAAYVYRQKLNQLRF
jgi:hypothetical protein